MIPFVFEIVNPYIVHMLIANDVNSLQSATLPLKLNCKASEPDGVDKHLLFSLFCVLCFHSRVSVLFNPSFQTKTYH
jgi:hypothetical protein